MRKMIPVLGGAILLAASMPAFAAPDNKAPNAAYPSSGSGCLVRDGAGDPYAYDANCSYHIVVKYNADGSRAWFRYQDKGKLQLGNTVPASGTQTDISAFLSAAYGVPCSGTEVVSPSGNYASNATRTY